MLDDVARFDMAKPPKRQLLRPLIWLLTFPEVLSHKSKIKKINMEGIKPPYLLLGNHNAFLDFKVATKAIFPHRTNYVIAIDGFIKREWILRRIGGICKRKFTNDIVLIKHLKTVVNRGDIAIIYPEARYSLCGTNSEIFPSVAKLAKYLDVPLVTLICHGHHVNSPFWDSKSNRKVKGIEAEMTCLFNKEEIEKASVEEIHKKLSESFIYDDFKWQKENNIHINYKDRAEGLHKVLYKCPHCLKENKMESFGATLRCKECNKEWTMNELGELEVKEGEVYFSHIPDWYDWERECVKREIEEGKYYFEDEVRVDSLPNAKGYFNLGKGKLIHDMQGFRLFGKYKGKKYEVELEAKGTYSVHIEYNYLFKYGDCVDLNTLNDTLYVYPQGDDFSVTKISLATEELYKYLNK